MPDQRTPLDKAAISDLNRTWMEFDARSGRPIDARTGPSRSLFGRILDFFDDAAKGSHHRGWR